MKKLLALLLVCLMMLGVVAGCASDPAAPSANPGTESAGESEPAESTGPKAPEDMTAEDWENLKNETRSLTIELLPNTFTEELWTLLVDGFKEDHPNWEVELNLSAESAENQQALILNGTPPVFFQPSADFSDTQALEADALQSMEPLYDAPAYDEEGMTVRETLLPGQDKGSMKDGKSHVIPYRFGGNGFWYNAQMFEDNGWEEPVTYQELLDLCAEIKAAGITPIMFTGTFAPYMFTDFIYPRMCALTDDPYQMCVDMANLEDNSWTGPEAKQAIEEMDELFELGYLPEEGLGTDYLLAQQMFFEGKAAMVLSGTWLESEMIDSIPEGFKFKFMASPVLESRDDPRLIQAFAGGFALCKGSGKEVEAMEFIRYVLSNEFMKLYAEKMGEPVITQATAQLDTSKFTYAGLSIYETFKHENTIILSNQAAAWYAEFYNNYCNGIIGTLVGNETIDNLLPTTEAAMQEIKADDDIVKYVLE